MSTTIPLEPGCFYHVYNRVINGENLFIEERNYRFFLKRYAFYIEPIAQTYAYCLLRNHFHLLVRILSEGEQRARYKAALPSERESVFKPRQPSQQFSRLFNSFAKAINKAYGRQGNLFSRPFKRIPVTSSRYFAQLVVYIHRNPQHHGFVDDFREWPYSSYGTLLCSSPTRLQRDTVLEWFGDDSTFRFQHQHNTEELRWDLTLEDE